MKKFVFAILTLILLSACEEEQKPEDQLKSLSGYWQIERVEFSEDSIKTYKANPLVDYFEFEDFKGYRKKVKPKIDGTYTASEDSERVEAKIEDDSLRLYYHTPYDNWKETVITAGNNKMSILNREGHIYHYKRFTPLLSEEEDEKEK